MDDLAESDGQSTYSYLYVGQIPSEYHSADLRAYFSQYVEKEVFKCFHFKHRPESLAIDVTDNLVKEIMNSEENRTLCCIIQIYNDYLREFMDKACTSPWYNRYGTIEKATFPRLVKLNVTKTADIFEKQKEDIYMTRKEKKADTNRFSLTMAEEQLQVLQEFKPPPVMPKGNVGTSSKTIMELIRTCKIPSKVLHKLEFHFPKSISKKLYGSVPYTYDNNAPFHKQAEEINEKRNNYANSQSGLLSKSQRFRKTLMMRKREKQNVLKKNSVKCIPNSNSAEEWERHEALHEPKEKELLYEEEIELKWEKGGSGLVFYTDEFYWHTMKGSDFDEQTANDWDVDTGAYDETNYPENDSNQDRHNFAKRHLENFGWEMGTGLGLNRDGIVDPIEADGRSSRDKRGLGYFGAKLDRRVKRQKKWNGEHATISTVFDKTEKYNAT